jgi:hypothetical protein
VTRTQAQQRSVYSAAVKTAEAKRLASFLSSRLVQAMSFFVCLFSESYQKPNPFRHRRFGEQHRARDSYPQREALQEHMNPRWITDFLYRFLQS